MNPKYLKQALPIFLLILNFGGFYLMSNFYIKFILMLPFFQISVLFYGAFCIGYPILIIKAIIAFFSKKTNKEARLRSLIKPLVFLLLFLIVDYLSSMKNTNELLNLYYIPRASDYVCNSNYFIRYGGYDAYRRPDEYKDWHYFRNYSIHKHYTFYWYDNPPGEVTYTQDYDNLSDELAKVPIEIQECRNSVEEGITKDNMPLDDDYVCSPEVFIIYQESSPELSFYEVHINKPTQNPKLTVYKTFSDLTTGLSQLGINIKSCHNKYNQPITK